MRVAIDGRNVISRRRTADSGRLNVAFTQPPTIVCAASGARELLVDFLTFTLPYISDPQVARHPVEAVAERISESIGPNFVRPGSRAGEWVAGWNLVVFGCIARKVVAAWID